MPKKYLAAVESDAEATPVHGAELQAPAEPNCTEAVNMTTHGRVAKWKVAELRQHPKQDELFDDLSDGQLGDLAADMDANGQRDPIHVLPDGTVLDGHQRCRAAQELGWADVDVVVREDLATVDEGTIEVFMIGCNLHRRQMDPLSMARVYQRLKQIELGRDRHRLSARDRRELRDRLAHRLGCKSGRTLDRYVQLLDTPREVQNAVSEGRLPMSDALKVVGLTRRKQQGVADGIRAGRSPKEVIAHFFPTSCAPPGPENNQVDEVAEELQATVNLLENTIIELIRGGVPLTQKIAVMKQVTSLLRNGMDEDAF